MPTKHERMVGRQVAFQVAMLFSTVCEVPLALEKTGQVGELRTTAELAPCTCPEFCERDHDLD